MTQKFFVTVSSQYRTGHSADLILIHFSPVGINALTLSNINFKFCLIIPSSPKNSHSTWSGQNFVWISHLPISVPHSVRLHIIPHSHNDAAYNHIFLALHYYFQSCSIVGIEPSPWFFIAMWKWVELYPLDGFQTVFPRFVWSECTF